MGAPNVGTLHSSVLIKCLKISALAIIIAGIFAIKATQITMNMNPI